MLLRKGKTEQEIVLPARPMNRRDQRGTREAENRPHGSGASARSSRISKPSRRLPAPLRGYVRVWPYLLDLTNVTTGDASGAPPVSAMPHAPGLGGPLERHPSPRPRLPDFEVIAWRQGLPDISRLKGKGDRRTEARRSHSLASVPSRADRSGRQFGLSSPCRRAAWRARFPSSASRPPSPRW